MTNQTKYPFQDTTLELDARVKDLVSRLTEDEKSNPCCNTSQR